MLLTMQELAVELLTKAPSALWKGHNCDDLWAISSPKQPVRLSGARRGMHTEMHLSWHILAALAIQNLKEHSVAGI